MDLRFPAPSSDDAIPLDDDSASSTSPVAFKSAATKGSPDSNLLVAHSGRVTDGPTITSVTPTYRPVDNLPGGGLLATPKGTDQATNSRSQLTGKQTAAANGPTTASPGSPAIPASSSAATTSTAPAGSESPVRVPKLQPKRRARIRLRHLLPAWSVSLLVHIVILSALAAATFSAQDKDKKAVNFDSALAGYRQGEPEDLNVWADPANIPREDAIGKEHGGGSPPEMIEMAGESAGDGDSGDGGGMVVAAAFGSGAPTQTPRFRGTGKGGINESNSLPNLKIEGMHGSPLNQLPSAPAADLYGGGRIGGDPTFDVQGIGPALDQLAREILRHLKDHKITVVWLFDESQSMQDDQRSIAEKFDRVSSELKKNIEPGKKSAGGAESRDHRIRPELRHHPQKTDTRHR